MKRSIKWGAFIEEMVKAERSGWQSVVQRMAWAYRRAAKEPPQELKGWFKFLPVREEWDEVRTEITRRRRQLADRAKYVTKEQRDALKAQKRHYMRNYMRQYRQRVKAKEVGATSSIS